MAKTATKVRKKVKKNVAEGIAHVHASFNNTIITITDRQGNACRGRLPAGPASRVRASPRRSLPRWLPRLLARLPRNAASRTSKSASRDPVPAASLRVRALNALGMKITSISDVTPVPHNGCRPPKKRRI
jgi:small subunit ribosomal protein S11